MPALRVAGAAGLVAAGMSVLDDIEAMIPDLRRYAQALMRDAEAGDDLVQDALERAVRRLDTRRKDASLRAWMFRILINRHRDVMRRQRRVGYLVPVDALAEEPSVGATQDIHMALRETEAAIARLPEDQRRALLLVALDGLSFDDAAAALDIPRGTLMSRLARGREALRTMTGRARPGRPAPAALPRPGETKK
ncbi:MAG: sigma-70 family RNA polymerase sigma factor [Marinibacterium sp.]